MDGLTIRTEPSRTCTHAPPIHQSIDSPSAPTNARTLVGDEVPALVVVVVVLGRAAHDGAVEDVVGSALGALALTCGLWCEGGVQSPSQSIDPPGRTRSIGRGITQPVHHPPSDRLNDDSASPSMHHPPRSREAHAPWSSQLVARWWGLRG